METVEQDIHMEADDLPPIKAVYDDELADFLRSLGILEDIESGSAHCKYCGIVVTVENLMAVVPDGDNIAIVCDKIDCQESLGEQSITS